MMFVFPFFVIVLQVIGADSLLFNFIKLIKSVQYSPLCSIYVEASQQRRI